MSEHKNAQILRELAAGASLDDYEIFFEGTYNDWKEARHFGICLLQGTGVARRKAKMIRIGDVEFPEPVREPLTRGTPYFYVNLSWPTLVSADEWTDHSLDRLALRRGIVHLTEEGARQHAEALIKLSGGEA